MDQTRPAFGPFSVVRPMGDWFGVPRYLGLHQQTGENRTLYQISGPSGSLERRLLVESIELIASHKHEHALGIERYSFDNASSLWLVTPYLGNHEGLVTLRELVTTRRQTLSSFELKRTSEHVLGALDGARRSGIAHGPVHQRELLIDPRGSVSVELLGLRRAIRRMPGSSNELVRRDEVRSFVAAAYELATGLSAEEPRIRASRVSKRLPRAWDDWFENGLDPFGGYASPADALACLPGRGADVPAEQGAEIRTRVKGFRRARIESESAD